jgi:radical SAM protein with 4Fe4S-binding SPASM domain
LDYIIQINKQGRRLVEGHASILLKKILELNGENYMELRSPCGGVIGQIAYYYDGNIYTCDEGRMLSEMGDDSFKLGNVFDSNYKNVVCSNKCKAVMSASFLESIPECCDCVYHPYCGDCPVLNLALEQDVFPRTANNYKCKIYKGMLNIIFEYLYKESEDIIDIFMSWIH